MTLEARALKKKKEKEKPAIITSKYFRQKHKAENQRRSPYWPSDKEVKQPPRVGNDWRLARKRVQRQNKNQDLTMDPVLAALSPKDRGVAQGTLVHKQLQVYAMDQFYGTKRFTEIWGNRGSAGVGPHSFTVAALASLESMQIQLACAELIIVNAKVPVATAIDLVGWHRPTQSPVIIEVKTGSSHHSRVGTAAMQGPSGIAGRPVISGGLGLSNSPWNQALVQLACMYGTVQSEYGLGVTKTEAPLLGLLLWIDKVNGVRTKWLHHALPFEAAPGVLLKDLQRFQSLRVKQRKTRQRSKKTTRRQRR